MKTYMRACIYVCIQKPLGMTEREVMLQASLREEEEKVSRAEVSLSNARGEKVKPTYNIIWHSSDDPRRIRYISTFIRHYILIRFGELDCTAQHDKNPHCIGEIQDPGSNHSRTRYSQGCKD